VWFAGFLATAIMLVVGALRLKRTASHARFVDDARWLEITAAVAGSYGLRRRILVLQTDTRHLLATWGVFRPCVIVPSHAQDWSDDRIHVVLCHELAHVRRLDWLIQTAAEALRTVLWFNPLIWIVCTRLRRESEHACDDLVLGCGVAARDYATHLLELARECRLSPGTPMPALPMARRSTLERRIADMLNPRIDRKAPTIRSIAIPFALLLAVTVPTASIRAGQAGPATLSGTVYDVTGAVMPGVALTLEDVTQVTHDAATDFAGRFAFSNVQPGHYTLQASLPGFRTMRQEFDLNSRRDWDRAITLQVGDLKETVTISATRLAAPMTTAAGSPQPIRVGGSVRAPKKTFDVHPIYPPSMQQTGREGEVPIEAIIGRDGTVTSVRVLSAQVHPDFAIAAVDAVRQWRFTPTLLNGSPVEVVMRVTVAFKLSEQ
jgi:TonB family protein